MRAIRVAGWLAGVGALLAAAPATRGQGAAYAWGNNYAGGLGNGTTTASTSPVAVVGGLNTGVTAVSGGVSGFSLALKGGAVFAWGDNYAGQLGNNSTASSSTPVAVTAGGLNSG